MSADGAGHRTRAWDTVVLWNESAASWWWNAWSESTATEMSGLSPSVDGAHDDMSQRIADADRVRRSTGPR